MTQPSRPQGASRPWFKIKSQADDAGGDAAVAELFIYEEIGDSWWGGVSAKDLANDLAALEADTIRVFINSPGGAAWDGIAIMNALRRHKARVEIVVDGLAASAASVIAMAGDHITMNRGSELMIHDAWGFAMGNAADMEEMTNVLHKLSDSIADTYAGRAGGTRVKWRDLMQAETWYTAEEAVTAGLADEWVDAPAASASFDMSKFAYAYANRAHAPAPTLDSIELPASEPGEPNRKEELAMSETLAAGLRERLGVTDAAVSDEQLLAAVDEALAEQTSDTASSANLPEGVVLMDAAALADLQASAALGRQAREEQDKARREGLVNLAVEEGRIAPASRDAWLGQLAANEAGTASLLASLAKNTIPVVELGITEEASTEDRLYAAAWGADQTEA